MRTKLLRIAFVHNYYIHYRVPFFEQLSMKYNVVFFFDAIQSYIEHISSKIRYILPFNIKVRNFAIPVLLPFYLIRKKFDVFIAGDAANISTVTTFFVSKMMRKSFILWEERWFIRDKISAIMWPFIRFISYHAGALIVPGTKSKEFFVRIGVPTNKIFIAPNASNIKASTFNKKKIEKTRQKLGLLNKTVILYIGRVTKIKGVSTLLKAFTELHTQRKDIYLIVAGDIDTKYQKELNQLSKNLNTSKLKITGHLSMSDREFYFKMADVIVVPSITEVWGLAINEALVAGKPVISTKTTGASYDLIQNNINGFIIYPDKVDALIYYLKLLIENPKLMIKFGKNSKKIAEQGFTYNHMITGFDNALDKIS